MMDLRPTRGKSNNNTPTLKAPPKANPKQMKPPLPKARNFKAPAKSAVATKLNENAAAAKGKSNSLPKGKKNFEAAPVKAGPNPPRKAGNVARSKPIRKPVAAAPKPKPKPKNAKATNNAVQQPQNDDEMDPVVRAKRIADWKERFKSMRIYFDGIDSIRATKFKTLIKQLHGTVEQYLSYSITHIVSGNPEVFDVSRNVSIEGVEGPDVMHLAKVLDASLWTIDRECLIVDGLTRLSGLENVLDCIVEPYSLQNALRNEKMFGMGFKPSNLKKFTTPYILIEEPSMMFKPIAVREYPFPESLSRPPWPIIYLDGPSKNTAFAPRSLDESNFASSSEGANDEGNIENHQMPIHNLHQEGKNQAASGYFSGSVAQNINRNVSQNPIIAKMSMRVNNNGEKMPNANNKREREEEAAVDIEELSRVKRKKNYHVYPMVLQKAGFCENCNAKYDDYSEHIATGKHRRYATNKNNFLIIDNLVKGTQRTEIEESSEIIFTSDFSEDELSRDDNSNHHVCDHNCQVIADLGKDYDREGSDNEGSDEEGSDEEGSDEEGSDDESSDDESEDIVAEDKKDSLDKEDVIKLEDIKQIFEFAWNGTILRLFAILNNSRDGEKTWIDFKKADHDFERIFQAALDFQRKSHEKEIFGGADTSLSSVVDDGDDDDLLVDGNQENKENRQRSADPIATNLNPKKELFVQPPDRIFKPRILSEAQTNGSIVQDSCTDHSLGTSITPKALNMKSPKFSTPKCENEIGGTSTRPRFKRVIVNLAK